MIGWCGGRNYDNRPHFPRTFLLLPRFFSSPTQHTTSHMAFTTSIKLTRAYPLEKQQQADEWLEKLHQSCQWADLKLAGGGVITGFFVPAGLAQNIRNDVQTPSTWLRTFLDGLFSRISCDHFGVAITRCNQQITPSTKRIFSFDPLSMFMPERISPTLDELFRCKQLGQETFLQCSRCHRATLQDGAKKKRAKTNPSANARSIPVPEVG
jgi:hypothetical protein